MHIRTDESIKLLIFLGVNALLVVAIVTEAFRMIVARLRARASDKEKKPLKISRRLRIYRRTLAIIALAMIVCFIYGFYEPYRPEVVTQTIEARILPNREQPIRIVQISDTHCDAKVRLEERLSKIIGDLRPDLIVFSGDAVNSPAGLENFEQLIAGLCKIAPLCAIQGNWDLRNVATLKNIYTRHKAIFLDNESIEFNFDGTTVNVAGLNFVHPSLKQALKNSDKNDKALTIVLGHSPDTFFRIRNELKNSADLLCCGHTHGGQIAPLSQAIVTLTQCGLARGMYELDGAKLYVNRGIGMEGGKAPRVRFGSRPEITMFEIVPLER